MARQHSSGTASDTSESSSAAMRRARQGMAVADLLGSPEPAPSRTRPSGATSAVLEGRDVVAMGHVAGPESTSPVPAIQEPEMVGSGSYAGRASASASAKDSNATSPPGMSSIGGTYDEGLDVGNLGYQYTSVQQVLHDRENIEYQLTIREQPKHSRMCGVGEKADRRPIDPAPIIQLRVITHEKANTSPAKPLRSGAHANADTHKSVRRGVPVQTERGTGWEDKAWYLENPYYFMYAMLADAETDEELHLLQDGKTRYTTGSCVSSLYHLKDIDGSHQGFFVFPDLSIRVEGKYRLKLCLFETIGQEVHHCKSIYSAPFFVYTAKRFPGMTESTALSRSFADQGLKVRVRKNPRARRRALGKRKSDGLSEDSDEYGATLMPYDGAPHPALVAAGRDVKRMKGDSFMPGGRPHAIHGVRVSHDAAPSPYHRSMSPPDHHLMHTRYPHASGVPEYAEQPRSPSAYTPRPVYFSSGYPSSHSVSPDQDRAMPLPRTYPRPNPAYPVAQHGSYGPNHPRDTPPSDMPYYPAPPPPYSEASRARGDHPAAEGQHFAPMPRGGGHHAVHRSPPPVPPPYPSRSMARPPMDDAAERSAYERQRPNGPVMHLRGPPPRGPPPPTLPPQPMSASEAISAYEEEQRRRRYAQATAEDAYAFSPRDRSISDPVAHEERRYYRHDGLHDGRDDPARFGPHHGAHPPPRPRHDTVAYPPGPRGYETKPMAAPSPNGPPQPPVPHARFERRPSTEHPSPYRRPAAGGGRVVGGYRGAPLPADARLPPPPLPRAAPYAAPPGRPH